MIQIGQHQTGRGQERSQGKTCMKKMNFSDWLQLKRLPYLGKSPSMFVVDCPQVLISFKVRQVQVLVCLRRLLRHQSSLLALFNCLIESTLRCLMNTLELSNLVKELQSYAYIILSYQKTSKIDILKQGHRNQYVVGQKHSHVSYS